MAESLPSSLTDIVDVTYDDSDDAETMTAAQVLAKLEEVSGVSSRSGLKAGPAQWPKYRRQRAINSSSKAATAVVIK